MNARPRERRGSLEGNTLKGTSGWSVTAHGYCVQPTSEEEKMTYDMYMIEPVAFNFEVCLLHFYFLLDDIDSVSSISALIVIFSTLLDLK